MRVCVPEGGGGVTKVARNKGSVSQEYDRVQAAGWGGRFTQNSPSEFRKNESQPHIGFP